METPRINNQPLYLQAINALRAFIQEGSVQPGDMLPREEVLARQFGISRLTLREAMGYLEADGIIERKRGVGTFVSKPSGTHFAGGLERLETLRTLATIAGLKVDTVVRQVDQVKASPEWASKLEVPEGTDLVCGTATQAINGCTVACFEALCSADLIDAGALTASGGTMLEYLVNQGVHIPTRTYSQVFAVNADERISQTLGVPRGAAVLHLVEVYYVARGRPIVLAYNYFVTNSFNFYISRRVIGHPLRR